MSHQGPPRPFRPIAPRTLLDTPNTGPVAEESKIRRASTACTECQRRRTKCSAQSTGSPCSECALHGRDCTINETADKRRKVARDRVEEELAYYRGFLEQLLKAIRHGNRADIDAIIDVIRSGASEKEIRLVVARSLGLELTFPDLKEPDGVSVNSSSSDLKSPDGISAEPSPDLKSPDGVSPGSSLGLKRPDAVSMKSSSDSSGLSAILNNDP